MAESGESPVLARVRCSPTFRSMISANSSTNLLLKSRYVLGISAFYHDSAACLIADGIIVAAAQEERFTLDSTSGWLLSGWVSTDDPCPVVASD